MLNIDEIQNGLVIDHIKAGTAIGLMDLLGIKDNRTASVALIQNARSRKSASGRKDIIKVEGDASWLNLDVLAYLDPDISVTVIENGKPVRKERPKPPKRLVNIVRCRCYVSSIHLLLYSLSCFDIYCCRTYHQKNHSRDIGCIACLWCVLCCRRGTRT